MASIGTRLLFVWRSEEAASAAAARVVAAAINRIVAWRVACYRPSAMEPSRRCSSDPQLLSRVLRGVARS